MKIFIVNMQMFKFRKPTMIESTVQLWKHMECVLVCSVTQLCRLFPTLWTVACQAPQFMGFSRQEYWNGLPFPPQGFSPTQELNPRLP